MASRHVFKAHAQMAQCVFVEMIGRRTSKRLRAAADSECNIRPAAIRAAHKGQTLGKESQNSLCHWRQLIGFSKMLKARRKSGIKAASEWVCYLDRKEDAAR